MMSLVSQTYTCQYCSNKFTKEKIENYTQINYYDSDQNSISTSRNINQILSNLLIKTESDVRLIIKDEIKNQDNLLLIKEFTGNNANKFLEYMIQIEYSNLIKSFEKFKYKN